MKSFATLILAALMAAPAHAADIYTEYETFTSQPGETESEFVMRVAPYVRDKTIETGWELCGAIARNGEQLGVTLTSSQSALACALRHNVVPEGMTSTQRSIHSHPGPNSKQIDRTQMDQTLGAQAGHSLLLRLPLSEQRRLQAKSKRDGFSSQDMETGPGYLVLEQQVLVQEGFGKVKRVGRLDK